MINHRRIDALDYLRGIMACSIMIYHFSSWTWGEYDSGHFLGRIGLYGVSFFYILSGLTLFIVYKRSMSQKYGVLSFAIKRVFRILPLLWLATIAYSFVVNPRPTGIEILLNLSGLFGFIDPAGYIATGAWSIGNEMVFYAFFPFLLYLERKDTRLYYLFTVIIFAIGFYFAFDVLRRDQSLADQWRQYVNPFNQFFLFAGGVLIGHLHEKFPTRIPVTPARVALILLAILFCFFPQQGDLILMVTSWNRLLFSFICLLMCAIVYWESPTFSSTPHVIFSFLGEASYSIYLLSPLVFGAVKLLNEKLVGFPGYYILVVSIPLTLIVSFFCYRILELPMMQVGKSFSKALVKN